MSTFKICTMDRTHWITDVQHVDLISCYPTTIEGESSGDKSEVLHGNEVLEAMNKNGFESPNVLNLATFQKGNHTACYVSLRRLLSDEVEYWVAPAGSCYIMGDSGQTIDRF